MTQLFMVECVPGVDRGSAGRGHSAWRSAGAVKDSDSLQQGWVYRGFLLKLGNSKAEKSHFMDLHTL